MIDKIVHTRTNTVAPVELPAYIGTAIKPPARGGSGAYANTGKRFRIAINNANYGARVTQSAVTFEVNYSQLSRKIQNIQKTGGKILSITQVG